LLYSSTIFIAGNQQTAAEALLGLFHEEGTADELIVGLDTLSLGDHADNDSFEDPADGDMIDGAALVDAASADDAVDDNGAGGDASLNDLRRMGQALHRFDVFETFFDDFVGEIEWGGFDYEDDEGLSGEMADSAEGGGATPRRIGLLIRLDPIESDRSDRFSSWCVCCVESIVRYKSWENIQ
jgi:hypothetical protein